jgi:hypothetical protein
MVSNIKTGANPPTRDSTVVQAARLYRALEYFTVGDRMIPSATGGRVPGMININTIWDEETFLALCAGVATANSIPPATAAPPNDGHFNEDHVRLVWKQIYQQRTPGLANTTPSLAQTDQPFSSFAGPDGNPEFSLLRTSGGPSPQPVFQAAPGQVTPDVNQHPYMVNELLTKIAPHVTTRSNVFAVYLTVGFFEVMDDTSTPPKLGAEIQTTTNNSEVAKNFRRRRMFAIVDRTNLALDNSFDPQGGLDTTFRLRQAGVPPYHLASSVSIPDPLPQFVDIPVPAATGLMNGNKVMMIQYEGNSFPIHSLQEGPAATPLWIDTGARQEQVYVESFAPPAGSGQYPTMRIKPRSGSQLGYTMPHAAGFRISNVQLGNPGPQGPIDYNSPQYRPVVPYTFVIE